MNRKQGLILFVVLLAVLISASVVTAQGPTSGGAHAPRVLAGTAFTYQGQLKNGGTPVNATCNFQFGLWDASTLGAQVGTTQTVNSLLVTNGLFTTPIDFGVGAFESSVRFLAIAVKCGSSTNYAALTPRQEVTASPYAVYAANGPFWDQYGNGGTNPAYNFVGTIDAQSLVLKTNNAERMRILSNGNVGIGTNSPNGVMNVNGTSWFQGDTTPLPSAAGRGIALGYPNGADYGYLYAFDYGAFAPKNLLLNSPGGNVGIGTTNPRSKLEIQGDWNGQHGALTLTGDKPTIRFSGGFVANHQQWIIHEGGNGPGNLEIDNGNEAGTIWNNVLSMTSDGNVGIGTTNPTSKLEIAAQDGLAIDGYQPFLTLRDTNASNARSVIQGANGSIVFYPNSFIGGNPPMVIDNTGTTTTNVLRIRGGSDLAEKFDASSLGVIEPGTLMVIDENNPGKLKPSDQPYDTKVAGVASGAGGVNPGLTLQQEGVMEGNTVVAIAGRVYVKADATINPIKPGDLLTTSSLPGYAMKATDRERAQGAIIGKAMSELKEGTGLVLVLVNLQ